MKKLADIGFLGIDSLRTQAYLKILSQENLIPSKFINLLQSGPVRSLEGSVNDQKEDWTISFFCDKYTVEKHDLKTDDINDLMVQKILENSTQKYWIYSGPAGGVLKKNLFETRKEFIHIHPGLLPQYKGSTTIYYSLLNKDPVGCTALFLNEKIDCGNLIMQIDCDVPEDRRHIDEQYDPHIRSLLLAKVLKTYKETGLFQESKQTPLDWSTYYIIHPVLKHAVILDQTLKEYV